MDWRYKWPVLEDPGIGSFSNCKLLSLFIFFKSISLCFALFLIIRRFGKIASVSHDNGVTHVLLEKGRIPFE